MSFEVLLNSVRRSMTKWAGRFRIDGMEFEDMMQVAGIALWKAAERYGIDENNYEEYIALIKKVVCNELGMELRKSKVRVELNRAASLDLPLGNEEDGLPLHETLEGGSDEENYFFAERVIDKAKRIALADGSAKKQRGVIWGLSLLLDLSKEEVAEGLDLEVFNRFDLEYYLWLFFDGRPEKAIEFAYPGEKRVRNPNWTVTRAVEALKRALKDAEIDPSSADNEFFRGYGLSFPLERFFGSDRRSYIDHALGRTG